MRQRGGEGVTPGMRQTEGRRGGHTWNETEGEEGGHTWNETDRQRGGGHTWNETDRQRGGGHTWNATDRGEGDTPGMRQTEVRRGGHTWNETDRVPQPLSLQCRQPALLMPPGPVLFTCVLPEAADGTIGRVTDNKPRSSHPLSDNGHSEGKLEEDVTPFSMTALALSHKLFRLIVNDYIPFPITTTVLSHHGSSTIAIAVTSVDGPPNTP
ncbi:hypothetical protein ACOMHN_066178 [Nucella lapillus]